MWTVGVYEDSVLLKMTVCGRFLYILEIAVLQPGTK